MTVALLTGQTRTANYYRCTECGVVAKAVIDGIDAASDALVQASALPVWVADRAERVAAAEVAYLATIFCGGTQGCGSLLYSEDAIVGQTVKLHHAKSAARKSGVVVATKGRRLVIEVPSVDGTHRMLTERSASDPDLRF